MFKVGLRQMEPSVGESLPSGKYCSIEIVQLIINRLFYTAAAISFIAGFCSNRKHIV